jgi:hypothetical protein
MLQGTHGGDVVPTVPGYQYLVNSVVLMDWIPLGHVRYGVNIRHQSLTVFCWKICT